MRVKRILLITTTLVFIAAMITLTFTARSYRESRLPHVTVQRLTRESFSIQLDKGGTMTSKRLAIPIDMLGRDIFIITEKTVNGEKRSFAQKVDLELGLDIEGFFEVTGGLAGNEYIIMDSDRTFNNGDEVYTVYLTGK